ncbi:gene 25-like lysozyme [Geobacter sp. OR-1]|uniref:type VI secretion system baseplate subunit TssE n=1 Tax=Geobacter sp. OR-1 TaxID=1266765 RepID=UPI0005433B2B|nr:type VI secretion system baseplate subunit TssE [Geobacter sp. OR-1]GAM09410.1 gene 25-like lysozyme [Geobacter sp. OR-1]
MAEKVTVRRSLLDRLIERETDAADGPAQSPYAAVNEIRGAVIRDLENLLNTRRNILDLPESFTQVHGSLFTYGLKDFMSYNSGSASVRLQIRQEIERTIALFEPRLRNVTIRLDGTDRNERTLRFRISALLVADPVTEPIAFDTYLDINRGEFQISG